jgi:hypothetical protein
VNWDLREVHAGETEPTLVAFHDRSWFHLSGYVNAQNNRYRSAEKSQVNLLHTIT